MIFVVVGTQLPFDRMIRAVDVWAGRDASGEEVFAQIGPSRFRPQNIRSTAFVAPQEFDEHLARCSLLIAHAGMGSIISALCAGKPALIMPRLARYGEHRNDHQINTARSLAQRPGLTVAMDEHELVEKLDRRRELRIAEQRMPPHASPEFVNEIRRLIES